MSVQCECGEHVRDGQTFCRQCGKRVVASPDREEGTRELTRVRPVARPPRPPATAPSERGGPDLKVVVGGAAAVLVLAVGGYAFAGRGSDQETASSSERAAQAERTSEGETSGAVSAVDEVDPPVASNPSPDAQVSAPAPEPPPVAASESDAGPFTAGYIAQLGSYTELRGAESDLASLSSKGAADGILWSSDYSQMAPGYWVVFAGPFDSKSLAEQAADSSGISDAFARWISAG